MGMGQANGGWARDSPKPFSGWAIPDQNSGWAKSLTSRYFVLYFMIQHYICITYEGLTVFIKNDQVEGLAFGVSQHMQ